MSEAFPTADRKLVADEVARCRAMIEKEPHAAQYWTGRANLFEDAPIEAGAAMLRELSLRALGERDPNFWLKWAELNVLAQRARQRAGIGLRSDFMARILGGQDG